MKNINPRKILWLEDSQDVIDIFKPVLEANNFSVSATKSVATALRQINNHQFDSLLLDIKFPNSPKEGMTFLEEIRRSHPELKIVVFSGYLDKRTALALLNSGLILGYFQKPINLEETEITQLLDDIHRAFDKSYLNPTMGKIRIFVASSDSLKKERERIEQYFARKNDRLVDRGVYLQLTIWEKESSRFSSGRKQDEFNELVKASDIFFCLIFDKVGMFTKEEFDVALENFQAGRKPRLLFVFFKDAVLQSSTLKKEFIKVIEFKEEIQKHEQFYSYYSSVDDLIFRIEREIDRFLDLP